MRIALDKGHRRYLKGFEADWRDAYPGINAPHESEDAARPPRRAAPSGRAIRDRAQDRVRHWDHATLVELAVLAKDENAALDALAAALPVIRERWEPETTARNLRLIHEARAARGESVPWAKEIEDELQRKAKA